MHGGLAQREKPIINIAKMDFVTFQRGFYYILQECNKKLPIYKVENYRNLCKETVLIFVTGIKEYVFEVFDVAAFHYLLKPIEENKFMEVFDRAIMKHIKY